MALCRSIRLSPRGATPSSDCHTNPAFARYAIFLPDADADKLYGDGPLDVKSGSSWASVAYNHYAIGAANGCSAFIQNNWFENSDRPMIIANQGHDLTASDSTLSHNPGGTIKVQGNFMDAFSSDPVRFDPSVDTGSGWRPACGLQRRAVARRAGIQRGSRAGKMRPSLVCNPAPPPSRVDRRAFLHGE
ncbi:hypothetical protein [Sorangium sp. So ce1389]|uniref:hypothetical protein n=1 Tax=Sorangium sp. So ce1389 TaxID=3133336 RepID=UPI003F6121A6